MAPAPDWERLKALRARFLTTGSPSDYWSDRRLLSDYDQSFAKRIGWKWEAVLLALKDRGWQPPSDAVIWDWGCGTGAASEAIRKHWSDHAFQVSDRSKYSQEFTQEKLKELGATVCISDQIPDRPYVLLFSHLILELRSKDETLLKSLFEKASAILWVEPGNQAASRKLLSYREKLKNQFKLVLPCPHEEICGLIDKPDDWCHFFAPPPKESYQSRFWSEFSKQLSIDLRSLPVSYFVFDRNFSASSKKTKRLIGRPHVEKGFCRWDECSQKGVARVRLLKRENPERYRWLKKAPFDWTYEEPNRG